MNDREGDGCSIRVCVPLIERILKRCVLSMTGKKNCREENGTKKETDRKVDNDRDSVTNTGMEARVLPPTAIEERILEGYVR